MQFTIEARELRNPGSLHTTIEAASVDDAISKYVMQSAYELVSLSSPREGRESIATVRKDDSVYLVRVYAG